MPSSPPCLCGTSSSDPLHIVIRGRPLRALRWLAAGKQWEPKGSGARRGDQANKQQQQHVSHSSRSGWDGLSPKRGRRGRRERHQAGPSPPRQTLFFSASYPLSVVPSSALLFALAGCDREGPLGWCLCNLLGNF